MNLSTIFRAFQKCELEKQYAASDRENYGDGITGIMVGKDTCSILYQLRCRQAKRFGQRLEDELRKIYNQRGEL